MSKTGIQGVIFDLDGVIVTTDEYHYQAWRRLAERESIHFDREVNERLRGVSRMDSLDIILENAGKNFSQDEKESLAEEKNELYRISLNQLSPEDLLPGVDDLLDELHSRGIPVAIGSSSRNTPFILDKIGLAHSFDAVADGNMISKSKPDPEVFLLAAKKLNLLPQNCLVVEDADAGIEAALNAGCKALGVGAAADNPRATLTAKDLTKIHIDDLLGI